MTRPSIEVFLAAVAPAMALASEEAHGGHGGHGGIPWATLFFSAVNLVIFVGVLRRFVWPALKNWISERHQAVVEALEQAARARQEAEQLKAEWERRVANLGAELDTLRRQARDDIARERDQVLAAAQTAADAIRRDAARAAEQEVRGAQELLREEVARQALEIARELAVQRVTPAVQDQFIADFVNKVQA